MPSPETADRHQKAVYWAKSSLDDYGKVTISAAVEIDVRWGECKGEVVNAQGKNVAIDSKVVVAQDVIIDSILWLGTLEDYTALSAVSDLMQAVRVDKTFDVKGRNQRRVVSLVRYSDKLPTIV